MTKVRTLRTLLLATLLVPLGSPAGAGTESPGSAADEKAIRQVIAETTAAFSSQDAKAFARHYTSDARLVTVRGESMMGTAEIERGLTKIFETRAKAARLETLDVSIRFIRPDVALAHVINELSGLRSLPGELLPAHRELSIRVFVKDQGVWRVAAFHNTIAQTPGREYRPPR